MRLPRACPTSFGDAQGWPAPTGRRIVSGARGSGGEAFAEADIDVNAVPIVQGEAWSQEAARMLLDVASDATAILSMSVMQGLEVLGEARRRGIAVPRDLSVVAFNDLPEAATSEPPLTTVDGMNVEKGRAAARLVLEGGPPRHEILPARLLTRASTGPPRTG